jgi:hypothetical protein
MSTRADHAVRDACRREHRLAEEANVRNEEHAATLVRAINRHEHELSLGRRWHAGESSSQLIAATLAAFALHEDLLRVSSTLA